MLCEHCGQVERVENAPCPNCKFQPYSEESLAFPMLSSAEAGAPSGTTICPECGTPRSDPNEQCERCKELDVCPTPPELALAICRRVSEVCNWPGDAENIRSPRILEPSAGDGAFVRAARQVWPGAEITAVEIRDQCAQKLWDVGASLVVTGDLAHTLKDLCQPFDLCIGNPPFSVAENHIRLLLGAMRPGAVLAFLLRTGFYESHTRISFWNEFPEDSFAPIVPRPGFKLNSKGKKGTDSQSYGLFIWTKRMIDPPGRTRQRADHIVWRDPAPRGRKKRDKPTEPHERLGDTRGVPPEPEPEPEVFDLE